MPNQTQGLERIIKAAGYSWLGIRAAWINEAAFRQELLLCMVLAPLGLYLGENGLERAVMIGGLIMVLIAELLNSALEAAVDRFGPEHHELVGRAKDMGSAAVFFALLLVGVSWALILWS